MSHCWIVIYEHRYGIDCWPVFQEKCPTTKQVFDSLKEEGTDFEADRGETIDIRGPWDVPPQEVKKNAKKGAANDKPAKKAGRTAKQSRTK